MPVQINEVIIRAVVEAENAGQQDTEVTIPPPANRGQEAEITEMVMEILKEKKER